MRRLFVLLFACSFAPAVLAGTVDLHLWQIQVQPWAAPGALVDTLVQYSNSGPGNADDVTLTLSIPPGTTYEGLDYDEPNPLTCTEPPKGQQGGEVVCTGSSLGPYGWAVGVAVVVTRRRLPER